MMLDATSHTAWILVGATATGKSAAAQWLAARHGAAVLSADAMLVYRGMDIGTAKPTPAERGSVPYLGLDCVEAGAPFSAGEWLAVARRALAELAPPRPVIVAGGTGLYVKALLGGLDLPASDPSRRHRWQALLEREGVSGLRRALAGLGAADRLPPGDRDNPRRLLRALETAERAAPRPAAWRERAWPMIVGLRLPRAELRRRIEARVARMFAGGLIAEAVALRARHGSLSPTAAQAIGYAEALACHDGLIDLPEAMARAAARTRQLAKRQETWFRHQLAVHWVDIEDETPVAEVAGRVLQAWRIHGPAAIQA